MDVPDGPVMEGGEAEEEAEAEANAGEVIVPLGQAGEYQVAGHTFAVRVLDVVSHDSLQLSDPNGLFADFASDQAYWAVEVEVTNTGTAPALFSRFPLAFTADDVSYTDDPDASSALTAYRPGVEPGGDTYNPGATFTAIFAFAMPEEPVTFSLAPPDAGPPLFLALR